jgi:hypothetical protein
VINLIEQPIQLRRHQDVMIVGTKDASGHPLGLLRRERALPWAIGAPARHPTRKRADTVPARDLCEAVAEPVK